MKKEKLPRHILGAYKRAIATMVEMQLKTIILDQAAILIVTTIRIEAANCPQPLVEAGTRGKTRISLL